MTRSEYFDSLERIEAINPGEVLMDSLKKGFTPINVIYMRQALARLPKSIEKDIPAPRKTKFKAPQDLWDQHRRLFGEMNKNSNKLGRCKSDDERASVSREIRRIWSEIQTVKVQISHWEEHGHDDVRDTVDNPFEIPDTEGAIIMKRNSVRAQISKLKKQIIEAGQMAENDPERLKIPEYQKRIDELTLYNGHLSQAISARIHAT